jgi:hypothetical protein
MLSGLAAAALAASATFSSPVTLGPVWEHSGIELVETADPAQGAWLQFRGQAGGERLVRIGEDGQATPVELPPQLQDERLRLSPLKNGWMAAVDRYLPPSRAGEYCCNEVEEPESNEPGCCDDWVLAERSPRGHWLVQALPHSRGNRSWVSEPVVHHGHIEIAWGEPYEEAVRVTEAPLGRSLGRTHVARHVLAHESAAGVSVSVKHGSLYEVAAYGPDAPEEPDYTVERRLDGNGRFGAVHLLRSPLLYLRGTYFTLPDGSQLYLYSTGASKLLISRRAPFARRFERPHLVLPESDGSPEERVPQSFNGRLLITSEEKVPPAEHELIAAVAVSPAGTPAHARTIESQPGSSSRYLAGAIGNDGQWLVATVSWQGGPLWLHPFSPRCRYRKQKITLAQAAVLHEDPATSASVGRSGIFHVAWVDEHKEVQSSSVRVVCARR